jgi:hypothetical protein
MKFRFFKVVKKLFSLYLDGGHRKGGLHPLVTYLVRFTFNRGLHLS